MPIDVTQRRFRSGDTSDQLHYSKTAVHRALRTTIGQGLKACYEVPRDLPHEISILLMRLNRVESPS
jgi:hypothetical protein